MISLTPHDETLEGWGMRSRSHCRVVKPHSISDIAKVFAVATTEHQTIGLRGAGCSYGDAALNTDSLVLDCTALNHILAWDADTGVVTVEPGVTISQLWQRILPDGWWPAVVPGTSAVTIGGAAAMNVHGKNNWRIGCFGDHIISFDLLLPSGEICTCSRELHSELFHAAIGGLGLLGCFTSITLRAHRIYSGLVDERQTTHTSLVELIDAFETATSTATDLVAWIDTTATGTQLGRGLLKSTRDLTPGEDSAADASLKVSSQLPSRRLPHLLTNGLLPHLARPLTTAPGIWLANHAQWWRSQLPYASRPHRATYVAANFPLDTIPDWKETYRPGGLIQHQSVIPNGEALQAFRQILECSHAVGITPSFGVLKKHRADDFLLSYLGESYSLALDYPVRSGNEDHLSELIASLNDLVVAYNGRCYFAKDSTLTAEQVHSMYSPKDLARFLVLKKRYDPQGVLQTDLYRRLFTTSQH